MNRQTQKNSQPVNSVVVVVVVAAAVVRPGPAGRYTSKRERRLKLLKQWVSLRLSTTCCAALPAVVVGRGCWVGANYYSMLAHVLVGLASANGARISCHFFPFVFEGGLRCERGAEKVQELTALGRMIFFVHPLFRFAASGATEPNRQQWEFGHMRLVCCSYTMQIILCKCKSDPCCTWIHKFFVVLHKLLKHFCVIIRRK